MKITIVRYIKDHKQKLRELLTSNYKDLGFSEPLKDEIGINLFISSVEHHYTALKDNKNPIGFIMGGEADGILVVVDEKHRRMRVGTKLVNVFHKSHPKYKVFISTENVPAIKLFQSCGFEVDEFRLSKKE